MKPKIPGTLLGVSEVPNVASLSWLPSRTLDVTYIVERNGKIIGYTNRLFYDDIDQPGGQVNVYRVKAMKYGSSSPYSNEVTVTIMAQLPPPSPVYTYSKGATYFGVKRDVVNLNDLAIVSSK